MVEDNNNNPKPTPTPGLWWVLIAAAFSLYCFMKGCAPVFYN